MTAKRLLILGGNRYNLPSIQQAKRAGFMTLVADRNPDAPGFAAADVPLPIDLVDVDGLIGAVKQHGGIDGIVSMAEVGVRAAAEMSWRLGLPSISREAAACATSKAAMRRCWASPGKYSTPFRVVASIEESLRAADELEHYPLIVKPDRSFGGSRGVRRIVCRDEVPDAFGFSKAAGLLDSEVVIEWCAEGTEHSAEVLIWQGETSLLCIGQKVKSPQPYCVDLSVQYPAALTADEEADIAAMCRAAVEAVGLTQGPAHVEFAYTSRGPVLFELGARCGGGHTPQIAAHVSGVDEFAECCRMACGLPPRQFRPSARRGADYRFLMFPPGTVASINIPQEVHQREGILDAAATAGAGTEIRGLQNTSDRPGFVVALADDRPSAAELADWACEHTQVTFADGRATRALLLPELQQARIDAVIHSSRSST